MRPDMQNTARKPEGYQRNGSQSALDGTKDGSTMVTFRYKWYLPPLKSIRSGCNQDEHRKAATMMHSKSNAINPAGKCG
jgi:hypothetical protein